MKKILFSLLIFAFAVTALHAQIIVKGDMNDDGSVDVSDVTMTVSTILGNTPIQTISFEGNPFEVDNTLVVGTWYAPDGTSFFFNEDGTTSFPGGATYRFVPRQGRLSVFDAIGLAVKELPILKADPQYLLVVDYETDIFTYYVNKNALSTSITLNPTTLTMNSGSTEQLIATVFPEDAFGNDVTWLSSDESIATVDANGLVTAVAGGTATITATVNGSGATATCAVTVTQLVTSIVLSKTKAMLVLDGTVNLTASVFPENAANKNVTWSSSNEDVALFRNGRVIAYGYGSAVITCTAADGSGVTATCSIFVANPEQTVSTKEEFESAFYKERSNGDIDFIFVKSGGTLISLSNGSASKPMPSNGDIYIIGVDDEETGAKSGISFQFYLPINQESDHVSFHFENLIIECNGGNTANSKYLFSLKDIDWHYIETLELKNCEIRNFNRSLFRVQPNGDRADGSRDVGEIKLLNITGCTFHNGYALNNPMALFYMGMRCASINFDNNLFYDMNYMHSIISFAYLTEGDGRIDIDFNFSNNTFIAKTMNTVFNFNDFVGQMSNFQIHNNIFMVPDWRDERNNADITDEMLAAVPDTLQRPTEKFLASIMYGVGSISNNLLFGFKDARNYIDIDGEGTWFLDENSHLTMEEMGMSFDTFYDARNGDFRYSVNEKMATAGVDDAPLGARWLVKTN